MLKGRQIWIIGAAAVAVAVGIWWMSRAEPVRVVMESVETGTVAATVANTRAGTVKACRRAGLAPQVGGQLAILNVRKGDRVEPGQVLLELWNKDLKAQVDLAENDVVAVGERAAQACIVAEVAEKESRRIARLRESGMASEESVDAALGNQRATAAACQAANAEVKVAQARLRAAQATLERTVLRAPFSGRVADLNGELGEFVTPSPVGIPTLPTVDLIDDSCLYVTAPIDEVDAPAIRTGMPVRISMDAFPKRHIAGVVRRIAPYVLDIEKQARTVDVEADIDTAAATDLLPGYSADLEVILAEHANVLRVPSRSVLDGERVLVIDDGILVEKSIATGISNWEYTEVSRGLSAGDKVVVSVDREGVAAGAPAIAE